MTLSGPGPRRRPRRFAGGLGCVLALGWLLTAAHAETNGQSLAWAAGQPLLGARAPRVTLTTLDGTPIDLGALYGKQAVYLKFWATWCVPCRQQMPHFEHAYETAGPDLAVIAVNVGLNDSIEDIRAYQAKLGITMPIVRDDGRLAAAFHLRVTPQHIVIGRDGRVLYVGHLADARLDAALVAARTSPVALAATSGPDLAPAPRRFDVGDQLPRHTLRVLDGGPVPFRAPQDARPTVLVFLSPWCESYLATTRPQVSANCRHAREQVTALSADPGRRWVGIASGLWATPEDLRAYRDAHALHLPLSLDESGALFRAFKVSDVPTAIVADAGGRIVQRIDGNAFKTPDALRRALETP